MDVRIQEPEFRSQNSGVRIVKESGEHLIQ
jgi:hypothetical protein